jgi:hypothetical protein
MDFVKEIERLQQEQARRLGLDSAGAPGEVLGPQAAPSPTPASRKPKNRPGAGATATASAPVPAPDSLGSRAARGAGAVVAGWALLVPVAILLGFALSGLGDAWDGRRLYPFEALFVVGPLVLAVAVLQARRQIVAGIREGQSSARGPRVPWLVPVLFALVMAAMALSGVFPDGIPLARLLGA